MMHNAAIVGYGGMGSWHARHIMESKSCRLAGIYDIDPLRREAAAQNGIGVFESLEELLGSDTDICVIATPNDVHCRLVVTALEAGKNVIVEKPVAMTAEEVDTMYEAAHQASRLLTVHQNRRWDVDFLAIREILDSGKLGKPLNVESRIHGSRGIPNDWRKKKEFGGGMLFDWGVHLIDQMLLLFENEQITSVKCDFNHYVEPDVDDGFFLTIGFGNGARGFVEVNTRNFLALPRFYAAGTSGTALINDWRENASVIECFAWNERDVCPEMMGSGITKTMAPRDEITTRSYQWSRPAADGFRFIDNFCRSIEGQEELIVTEKQVKRVFRVITSAFDSADHDGRAVRIDETY